MVFVAKIAFEASKYRSFLMLQAGPDYCKGSWDRCIYARITGAPQNLLCKCFKKTHKAQINKISNFFEFIVLYVMEKAFYE